MTSNNRAVSKDKLLNVSILASIGSGLEYYDFVIYGMMAKYLAVVFFLQADELGSVIHTFAIFALGYLVRPMGGIIVGMIADTYGRKKIFTISMLTMAFSTTIIGLLPTYQQAGIISPVALVVCRTLQGLSFGAELPGALTIVKEFTKGSKLGKLYGIVLSSTTMGSIIATSMLAVLTRLSDHQEIISGLWRIPFIAGGFLAILCYYIRKNFTETPEFLENKVSYNSDCKITKPLKTLLSHNFKNVSVGIGLAFFIAAMIIINLYFPVYLNVYFNYVTSDIYQAMTISMIAAFLFMLLSGVLADYFSRTKIMLFSLVSCCIFLSLTSTLLNVGRFWAMQIFLIVYQLHVTAFFVSFMSILPCLFITNVRFTGIALVYNLAFLLASIMPSIISYLLDKYKEPFILPSFLILTIIIALFSLIALINQNKEKEINAI